MDFVVDSTQCFDSSHNWEHALAVTLNAIEIMGNAPSCDEIGFLPRDIIKRIMNVVFISMLHDVCDHKYPDSIPHSDLEEYCQIISSDYAMYLEIIVNVSWSKEKKGLRKSFNSYWANILNIVSDADRIEAIGKIGVERCIAYTIATGGNVPTDVITHYHEKLRLLYEDNYIRTEYGRKMALPRHLEMKQIIEEMVFSNV
jgi:uncharacterized protein